MEAQYLRETHIPQVVFRGQDSDQQVTLPDWLSAAYIDLHERDIMFGVHIVTESDLSEPDCISYKHYGSSLWWWLICSFNGIINPATDMYVGQKIKVPALQQAQLSLQSVAESGKDLRGQVISI